MKIIFDTEIKRFSLSPNDDAKYLSSISEELTHNVIRTIIRPNHESVDHWILDEVYGQLAKSLCKPYNFKKRRLEYIYSDCAHYCSSSKFFGYDKKILNDRISEVRNEFYGISKPRSIQTIALGMNLLIDLLRSSLSYTKSELYGVLKSWIELMKSDYESTEASKYKKVKIYDKPILIPFLAHLG